jgi:hypothetical protein
VTDIPNIWTQIGSAVERHFNTCIKCRRPFQGAPDADKWNILAFMMKVVYGVKCPDCQTDEERAEAVIRDAGGERYQLQGLLLVEQPKPPTDGGGDDEPQAKAG